MIPKIYKEIFNKPEGYLWLLEQNCLTHVTGFLVIECSHTEMLLEDMEIKSYQLFEENTQ